MRGLRDVSEAERIREAYARRAALGLDERYSLADPANRYLFRERERSLLALLKRRGLLPLADKWILDIGCGNGDVLRDFVTYGADLRLVAGVDLLPERVGATAARTPPIACSLGDATALPFPDATFDIALQFTLLSSVLNDETRRRIAVETLRVLRPRGTVIWYDFIWNPGNRDVRGIGLSEVRALYPDCGVDASRVTLAPPISRRLARVSSTLCRLFEAVPWLRSHWLIAIQKGEGR
jgi:SAM-dependent methyltransferase